MESVGGFEKIFYFFYFHKLILKFERIELLHPTFTFFSIHRQLFIFFFSRSGIE